MGGRPSARGSGDVRLFTSRFGWLAGLLSLLIGLSAIGWIVFGIVAAAWPDRRADSRGFVITGVALSTPAALYLAGLFGDAGRRLLGPRHGRIELERDRLVIHDRWMLRRPMEIWRSELTAIERTPRLGFWHYTAFAGSAGVTLGARGPVLDWGTRPNAVLVFHEPRHFVEAIRTLPGKTPLVPISTRSVSDCLLVRLADEEQGFEQLNAWMVAATWTPPPSRQRPPGPFEGCLRGVALWVAGFAGFAITCLGLALGAPS